MIVRAVSSRITVARLLTAGVLIGWSHGPLLADSPIELSTGQLDGISAGAVQQDVHAGAGATGLVALAETVTLANAVGVATPIPGVNVGGAAGGGGAVACCANPQTVVAGSTTVPGPFGAAGGGTMTSEFAGLSITIGAFGGAGVGP